MASKFDLKDILNQRSKGTDMQEKEYKTDGVVELVDIYDMIPSQDNFYDVTKHMDLVNSIKLLGVLQPVLLSESEEPDKYSIKAGHRRREACLYLVEQEGLEKFRYIPSIIKPEQDDVMGKLTIIMANRFRNKTDWEKMQEAIQTETLLEKLKGNKNLNKQMREHLKEMLGVENDRKMKTRDFVAEILGTSSTQIGRYDAIYKNLCMECMEVFKRGFINVSVAAEMAGLSPEWQMEAFELLQKNGSIQISDVAKLKQQERDSKPIEGQQTFDEAVAPNRNEVKRECVRNFYELVMNEQEKELARERKKRELQEELYTHHRNSGGANGKINWNCQSYEIKFLVAGMEDIKMSWFGFVILLFEILDVEEAEAELIEAEESQTLKRMCGATQQPCNFENIKEVAKTLDVECKANCCAACENPCGARCNYAAQHSNVAEEPEQFEAKPEYKDILCYSCLHYAECDKKAGTVFSCRSYVNKAQAEKTQEQLYSEEQDRIDRETARKIEEIKQKDIEALPIGDKREPRDDYEISITMRQYSEVYYGHINFLVTPKKDYRFNDTITLKEYCNGETSGKEIVVKVKNVVQDCTGIEDKYCVIGFYTVQK